MGFILKKRRGVYTKMKPPTPLPERWRKICILTITIMLFSLPLWGWEYNGYVFFKYYMDQKNLYCDPMNRAPKEYSSGIYAEISAPKYLTVFTKLTANMDQNNNYIEFHPAGQEYLIGLKGRWKNIEVIFEHECDHAVDLEGYGQARQWNGIEGRLHF